jgi:hypothetical protein
MEPAGSGLVAASPVEPAGGVAGWPWTAEGGEQSLDLVDGERDQPGVRGMFQRAWQLPMTKSLVTGVPSGEVARLVT